MRPRVEELLHAVAARPGLQGYDHGDPGSHAHARRLGDPRTKSPQVLPIVRAPHDDSPSSPAFSRA
eukprot:325162-Heterocapsa_arctica.AAC.1